MKKKLLALLLSGAMILSLTTPVALAEEPEGECCGSCGQVVSECTCEPTACGVCGEIECVCEDVVELPEEEVPGAAAPEIPEEPTACEICGEIECECEKIEEPEVPEVPEEPTACEKCGEIECVCEGVNDYAELYETLMNCESLTAYIEHYYSMTDEECAAFWDALSDEEEDALNAHHDQLAENAVYYSYTNAGPFMDPVQVEEVRPVSTWSLRNTRSLLSNASVAPIEDEGDAEGPKDATGLETSKIAVDNGDGTYTIQLEAYTTGTIRTETVTTSTPCDIVLVLDYSSSMDETFGTGDRLDALVTAVNNFVDSVSGQYTEQANHRMSIVKFCGTADVHNDWMFVTGNNVNALKVSKYELAGGSGTNPGLGMEEAQGQLTGTGYIDAGGNGDISSFTGERHKVVVMFTDGEPQSRSYAEPAINIAKTLKDNGATIYSVAIHEDANPTTTIRSWTNLSSPYINQFLHAISSNYPKATATYTKSNRGTVFSITPGTKENSDYYLVASDPDDLNNIFDSISDNIQSGSSTIDLGATAVIKDVVSASFALPANTSNITVETYDCKSYNESTGAATWSETGTILSNAVKISTADKSVNITGFDFNRNFVAATGRVEGDASQSGNFRGRKIVITFTVVPEAGFLGGNGVFTNGSASGIYDGNGTLVENFDMPTVDVLIPDLSISVSDYNVYLTGGMTDDALKAGTAITGNGVTINLDPDAENYGLEEWQNAYVNIGSVQPNDYSSLTEDAQYTVSVTVAPEKTDGAAVAKTISDTGNIFVYKPVITFQDSAIDPGKTANYDTENFKGVVWMHGTTAANNMTGKEPVLAYNYTPGQDAFTTDTDVQVKVSIGDTDVTSYTTFKRIACTIKDKCHTADSTVDTSGTEWVNFIVHINAFDLKIIKAIADGKKPDQNFVFEITDPNGFAMTVVIPVEKFNSEGKASITLEKVPAGTYTVKELTDWSWRYTADNAEQKASPSNPSVTFTNRRTDNQWLDGETRCQNVFQKIETGFVVNNNVVWKRDDEEA